MASIWDVTGHLEDLRWRFSFPPTSSAQPHPTTWPSSSWRRLPAARAHALWSLPPTPSWTVQSTLTTNSGADCFLKRICYDDQGTHCCTNQINLHSSLMYISKSVLFHSMYVLRCIVWKSLILDMESVTEFKNLFLSNIFTVTLMF